MMNDNRWVATIHDSSTETSLRDIDPTSSKLYILCHGHDHMPTFSLGSKADKFTAKQMASKLLKQGLSLDHCKIELLVRNAGHSVNSKKVADERMADYKEIRKAKRAGDETAVKKLLSKSYNDNRVCQDYNSDTLALPLAALFADELYKAGFEKARVVAYKAEISFSLYNIDGYIRLNLSKSDGRYGAPVKTKEQKMKWRSEWMATRGATKEEKKAVLAAIKRSTDEHDKTKKKEKGSKQKENRREPGGKETAESKTGTKVKKSTKKSSK